MELSKTQKILLGIASGWPLVYIFVFIAFIFAMVAMSGGGSGGGGELNPMFGGGFVVLILVHMFTIFLTIGLTVFYIVHAVKNAKLDSNMRIIWIVLFFYINNSYSATGWVNRCNNTVVINPISCFHINFSCC